MPRARQRTPRPDVIEGLAVEQPFAELHGHLPQFVVGHFREPLCLLINRFERLRQPRNLARVKIGNEVADELDQPIEHA